ADEAETTNGSSRVSGAALKLQVTPVHGAEGSRPAYVKLLTVASTTVTLQENGRQPGSRGERTARTPGARLVRGISTARAQPTSASGPPAASVWKQTARGGNSAPRPGRAYPAAARPPGTGCGFPSRPRRRLEIRPAFADGARAVLTQKQHPATLLSERDRRRASRHAGSDHDDIVARRRNGLVSTPGNSTGEGNGGRRAGGGWRGVIGPSTLFLFFGVGAPHGARPAVSLSALLSDPPASRRSRLRPWRFPPSARLPPLPLCLSSPQRARASRPSSSLTHSLSLTHSAGSRCGEGSRGRLAPANVAPKAAGENHQRATRRPTARDPTPVCGVLAPSFRSSSAAPLPAARETRVNSPPPPRHSCR
ncbi:MAG: hypothetical protein BJ554DRAFT_3065, partial [Olpidium bornovanus]